MSSRYAFSLVELSIVLVILGLLTGGILAGQSLIRAAELRSVITQSQNYITAVRTFRDKYMAIPGDMNNATQFWGVQGTASAPDCVTNSSAATSSTGTCDGNGDGVLVGAASTNGTGEIFQFWRQMALAGLIEGSYSGVSGGAGLSHSVIGTNVPRTRISNGGFSMGTIVNWGIYSGDTSTTFYDGDYTRSMQAGLQTTTGSTGMPMLTPQEMWNIDTKLDDGKPAYGMIRGDRPTSANAPNCADNNTASAANYKVAYPSIACRVIFIGIF